jgi:hypothetical protein
VAQKERELTELLELVGFTPQHRKIVGDAWYNSQLNVSDTNRLAEQLFVAMKKCVIRDDTGCDLLKHTGRYYVDVMGAASALDSTSLDFAQILQKWILFLERKSILPPFDAVLTPKNGNPALVHSAAACCSNELRVFIWKSAEDHSRVLRPQPKIPHVLDFEGLTAFERAHPPGKKKLRIVAIDDNFTSGRTLIAAIRQFNQLVETEPHSRYFEPIASAVVLFAVNHDEAERNFKEISPSFEVHSVLSVGPAELEMIASWETASLIRTLDRFQTSFSCAKSRDLSRKA